MILLSLLLSCGEPPRHGLERRPTNERCLAPEQGVSSDLLGLEPVFEGIDWAGPTSAVFAPDHPERIYVTEKSGRLRWADPGDLDATTALDLEEVIVTQQGLGLSSMAFDPEFETNGAIYLAYATTCERSAVCPSEEEMGDYLANVSRVSRFTSSDGGLSFPLESEEVIVDAWQPADTHMVDQLVFDADGMLMVSLGDGGCCGDPQRLAQDLSALNGKILRLDVSGGGEGYAVPPDNPFVDREGAEPAIWARGFRNPWRMSFDRELGTLWVGDVGQSTWEEVNIVERGGNYGWSQVEGPECYREDCDLEAFTAPVAWYDHSYGKSVIGGFVYRGEALPDLVGAYIFGDYARRQVWALWTEEGHLDSEASVDGPYAEQLLLEADDGITSFAEDMSGELYVLLSAGHEDAPGAIYRLAPPERAEGVIAETLSQTGCFDEDDPTIPDEALIPYALNAPFWSDGADKRRWMAIPDGENVEVESDGDLSFPIGTVLIKEFGLNGRRVETRLLMRHGTGAWGGYVYQWREDQSDADLVSGAVDLDMETFTWHIPTRGECAFCHTTAAGGSLGPEARQLDRDYDYALGTFNQLDTLRYIGLLGPTKTDELARWRLDQDRWPMAEDSVGEADGLLVGGPVWTGSALRLDGVDDHVETTVPSGDVRTLSLWLRPTGWADPSEGVAGLIDSNTSSNPLRAGLGLGLAGDALVATLPTGDWETGVQLELDRWQQVVLSVGEGAAALYVNGEPRASATYDPGVAAQERAFVLGCSATGSPCFQGELRDVRVFDVALVAEEALQLGMGADPDRLFALQPYVDPYGDAEVDERARAWLHTNCAPCHRPDGPGSYDLRYDTPIGETGMCDVSPAIEDLDIADARLIAPGSPERSMLWWRVQDTEDLRMPPISSHVPDEQGVALIEAWITGLEDCREGEL